jgi:threonine/homoserine/homoserine lactone efflux protein
VTSVTPGPNNFMLLASGVNFGFVRTIPHMIGIASGFFLLLVAVGFGLGALLTAYPPLHLALKIAGGAYLLYLAWRIAISRSMGKEGQVGARPMSLFSAAAFQWVNPKAWVMALTAMAVYSNPDRPFLSVWIIAAAFAIVNLPSVSVWAGFGVALRGFLADPVRLKWFNIAMGVLLALTLWPMVR